MHAIIKAHDGNVQMFDSSIVRVHQHAAGAKKGSRDRCVGRGRRGLTTKIHAPWGRHCPGSGPAQASPVMAVAVGSMHTAVLMIPMPPAVQVRPVWVAVHVPMVVVVPPWVVNLAVLMISMPVAIEMPAVWVAVHVPMMVMVTVVSLDILRLMYNSILGWSERSQRCGSGCCCGERQDEPCAHQ